MDEDLGSWRVSGRIVELERALESANDVCRSMRAIVDRPDKSANWKSFGERLNQSLRIQHEALNLRKPEWY